MKLFYVTYVVAAIWSVDGVAAETSPPKKNPQESAPVLSSHAKCSAPEIDATLKQKLLTFETYELKPISDKDRRKWLYSATLNGHPETPPPDTTALIEDFIKPDLVRRSVFRTCDGNLYYIRDRGGVIDQYLWFGPITDIDKPQQHLRK